MDALPPTLAGKFGELEHRIEWLERSNKLLASTITGGSLVVQDDDGVIIARIGRLVSGFDGLRVQTASGASMLEADQERGMVTPWLATPWRDTTLSKVVTSGTMGTVWETATELLFSIDLLFRVRVTVDAATTGELQVFHGQTAAVIGSVKSLTASTDAFYEFRFTHSIALNSGPHTFSLQARRASGAGNVTVYTPYPFSYGGNMTTVAGGWV